MKHMKEGRLKKIIVVSLITLTGLIILSGITAYFFVHSYIGKMNLVSTESEYSEEKNKSFDSLGETETNDTDSEIESFSMDFEQKDHNAVSEAMTSEISLTEWPDKRELTPSVTTAPNPDPEKETDMEKETNIEKETLDQNILNNVNSTSEIMDDPNVTNILIIGSDSRMNDERGKSDSMIIVTINNNNKKLFATSFLRDIYLKIPGESNNRLNAAYATGGADLFMKTLQENFKFKIDKFIMVDFFAFIDIVDAIGGLKLEVEEAELETTNNYIKEVNKILGDPSDDDLINTAGDQILNGKQALGYASNRYTAHGDFDRTEPQREVLTGIYNKAKQQNLFEMNNILNIILPKITTNFTEKEITSHILLLPTYFEYGMELLSIPISGTYENKTVNGMAVLNIDFNSNRNAIYKKLYEVE